jgi:hypothetical protein
MQVWVEQKPPSGALGAGGGTGVGAGAIGTGPLVTEIVFEDGAGAGAFTHLVALTLMTCPCLSSSTVTSFLT